MHNLPEPDLHWTDHYVKYGFAVRRGLVDRAFCARALDEVRSMLGQTLPLNEWTRENTGQRHHIASENRVLRGVYDDPGLRAAIDEMFGGPGIANDQRQFQLFISPYDPDAKAQISPRGHIDFVKCNIPVFGSGFMFQVSLVKSEPFSGNITIYPGTHTHVQRLVMNDRSWRFPANEADIPDVEPYEFVAEPGDVLFFHHLVCHSGNNCHSAGRSPRVVLHCQALRDEWLHEVDPDQPGLSPWERSLATNGRYVCDRDEKHMRDQDKQAARAAAR